jgi:hypothetical protein
MGLSYSRSINIALAPKSAISDKGATQPSRAPKTSRSVKLPERIFLLVSGYLIRLCRIGRRKR